MIPHRLPQLPFTSAPEAPDDSPEAKSQLVDRLLLLSRLDERLKAIREQETRNRREKAQLHRRLRRLVSQATAV
jgi:hypothetical protein